MIEDCSNCVYTGESESMFPCNECEVIYSKWKPNTAANQAEINSVYPLPDPPKEL